MLTVGVGNVWGATTVTYSYDGDATPSVSGTVPTGSTAALSGSYSDNGDWMQCANSGSAVLTLSGYKGYKITAITIHVKSNKSSGTGSFSVTAGSTTIASIASNAFSNAAWNGSWNNSGVNKSLTMSNSSYEIKKDEDVVFSLNVTSSGKSLYINSWTITYEAVAPVTSVTASPASITFNRVTLDPEDGAEGSKNVTISLTNGNVGYPGGVSCYLNGWVETDETDCVFFVNSDYTYQHTTSTTSETLSLSYYATDAGTFTGNFIIQGFDASHVAVNCTIPLSVIVDAPACDKTVTINKGTETNCSFTLSKSGAQASCSGVSTTVTVTPNTGYGTPEVTQAGASKTPTITGSGTSWTVTYPANTTGTSTINVSCSANNYTITLNTDLTPTSAGTTSITATYNANTNLTSAITKPTKTGWTFGGYFTAKNGGGTQIIDASGNVIASVSGYTDASRNWKYAGNITLYAKWTCTVTWSVNGLTNVYSTQTVTYNSSGSKVASVPTPDPVSYCGDIFAGWSQKNAGSESKTTSYYDDLFKTVGDSPDIKSIGNITFYAVFADEN